MSIDFLIGMTIFAGVFVLVLQFAMSSVFPFADGGEENTVVTQKVSENLVSDERWISTGKRGEVNTSDIENDNNPFDSQDSMRDAFGMRDINRINITVTNLNRTDQFASSGPTVTDTTATVSTYDRIAYDTDNDEKVRIRVRVW